MKTPTLTLLAVYFLVFPLSARADDWPQWRGPDRTGVSKETGLLKEWPKEGPKLLWKVSHVGGGYSTPSVTGGRIYLIGSRGPEPTAEEFAIALDARDGKEIWSARLGAIGPNKVSPYPGPRSTPTVDGDLVYALGSDGDLVCLETATGKERWRKNYRSDFEGKCGNWAYAESPLIDGEVLVCTPGGARATLAALNKKTGEVLWMSAVPGADPAAYASIIIAQTAGVKQYVQLLDKGVVGVAARDGKFLWRYDKFATGTNSPTPIFHDGYIFSSASGPRPGGAALLRLSADGQGVTATEVYLNKDLANHHGGVVLVGDAAFGTNNAGLVCVDVKTGETRWKNPSVGKGSVSVADGRLYVRSENGGVALVEATPTGYQEKGRFQQPDRSQKKAWPHPVIANGRLYLRDDEVLLCYDVKVQ
jgi:outer membrane protein assembly factor BamB